VPVFLQLSAIPLALKPEKLLKTRLMQFSLISAARQQGLLLRPDHLRFRVPALRHTPFPFPSLTSYSALCGKREQVNLTYGLAVSVGHQFSRSLRTGYSPRLHEKPGSQLPA
jgi:hypothetical protein